MEGCGIITEENFRLFIALKRDEIADISKNPLILNIGSI